MICTYLYAKDFSLGIGKDLIGNIHGTTEFPKQLILQHALFRDAIIHHTNPRYPSLLSDFNERILRRKRTDKQYTLICDGCRLSAPISSKFYNENDHGIARVAEEYFHEELTFHNAIIVDAVLLRTTLTTKKSRFADNCISFRFGDDQVKFGFIRAIVKSSKGIVRLLIEELIEKNDSMTRSIKFKANGKCWIVPNIFCLRRSNIYHLKHPKCFLRKNGVILHSDILVTVLEYPNIKDGS